MGLMWTRMGPLNRTMTLATRKMWGVCVCVCESLSCVRLFASPWTVVCQALLSMELSRKEYWRADTENQGTARDARLSQSRLSYLKLKALQMHSWERYYLDRQSTTGSKFRLDQEELSRERRPGDGGEWNCVW